MSADSNRRSEPIMAAFHGPGLCAACRVFQGQCPDCGTFWWWDSETGKRVGVETRWPGHRIMQTGGTPPPWLRYSAQPRLNPDASVRR